MSAERKEAGAEMLRGISDQIEDALRSFLDHQSVGAFYDMVRFQLGWPTGRRRPFRPAAVLCVLSCEACGGAAERALPMAIAVALLQSFELNQEDLAQHRRSRAGRQTIWHRWGASQAMNAGDGMHALAKMALFEARDRVPARAILHLEQELDECCLRYCEAVDEEQSGGTASEVADSRWHRARTTWAAAKGAVLFGSAAYAGCYLAGAIECERASRIRDFGEALGSAAAVRGHNQARAKALGAQAVAALDRSGVAARQWVALRSLVDYVLAGKA